MARSVSSPHAGGQDCRPNPCPETCSHNDVGIEPRSLGLQNPLRRPCGLALPCCGGLRLPALRRRLSGRGHQTDLPLPPPIAQPCRRPTMRFPLTPPAAGGPARSLLRQQGTEDRREAPARNSDATAADESASTKTAPLRFVNGARSKTMIATIWSPTPIVPSPLMPAPAAIRVRHEVNAKSRKICRAWAKSLQPNWADIARTRPNSLRTRPTLPDEADFAPNLADIARNWPNSLRIGPTLPASAHWATSHKVGRHRPSLAKSKQIRRNR